jgi:hypothetical protein
MTYRLRMPKRISSSFGVYFIQLPAAISMCQFCRNPQSQPSCVEFETAIIQVDIEKIEAVKLIV